MPISTEFQQRLYPNLPQIIEHFGTPFHIYDEVGIRETAKHLLDQFADIEGFQEYFAVKALPNPHILQILQEMGLGFDCSSIPELMLARQVAARNEDIMFTSNNTTAEEFQFALNDGGCILNLDDVSLLDKIGELPELVSFRYNPGAKRSGNAIIGQPEQSKFGIAHQQVLEAYRALQGRGVKRFGIHTMIVSSELDYRQMVETTRMLLDIVEWISTELGIQFEFINIGGGIGIPYRPDEKPFNLKKLHEEILCLFENFRDSHGYTPKLFMENGRFMTAPHGVLVTKVINRKETYRTYIGVDASMSALMRPGMYGAYHHIDVFERQSETEIVDVVGSLCENNDKFAVERELPKTKIGDTLIIQDTGAHGHSMGFTYNGRLRPKELLLTKEGTIKLIRRAETMDDYFGTLQFQENEVHLI